ncbi:MAG TPA: amidohydrolase [Chitinophagaceae bacterium]|nr:amidohydrolase [Chitinophagaceae bacterium]
MIKLIFFILALTFIGCHTKENADLIVLNAKIYTVDSAFSLAEAMAIKDGKILALGKAESILDSYVAKEKFDANGKFIYPGFIDAHAHFVGYGKSLFEVQLYDSKSWNEVIGRVTRFAKNNPNEKWIIGRGWDQNKFEGKQFPTNELLNQLFPDVPVMVTRVDGHAAIANAKALALAEIKPNQQLTGGSIETKNGKLTGLLIDNAVDLVQSKIPSAALKDYDKWLMAAQENCFEQGLTTITDCGLMYNDVEKIDSLQQQNKLLMKLYVMLSDDQRNYEKYLSKPPYKTNKLFVKGIKVYSDGALGSRGACLLQHYSDKPNWFGFLLSNKAHFDSLASILVNTPYQMCTHAIGDSANRTILTIYNKYLKGKNDKRWRIEHAQVINENDFDLFGKASVIPSVQPTHATSDMYWAEERLGKKRLQNAYAYKQLLKQNGWLPLGTDFPVEDISPFKTFLAAVIRKDAVGFPTNGFQKENALTREEALRGMTIWAAKANFLENETGSLVVGKKADFILLNNDLMQVPETEILNTKVIATWSDGKKVYNKK